MQLFYVYIILCIDFKKRSIAWIQNFFHYLLHILDPICNIGKQIKLGFDYVVNLIFDYSFIVNVNIVYRIFFFTGKNTSLCYSYESKDIFYNIRMMISCSHVHASTKVDINTEQQIYHIQICNISARSQDQQQQINDINRNQSKGKSLIIADFTHHP